MKSTKYFISWVLICTQGLVPAGFFVEFFIRGFQLPYVFGGLYLLRLMLMALIRDSAGEVLFALSRLSRFGPICYFSFDLLKSLKQTKSGVRGLDIGVQYRPDVHP